MGIQTQRRRALQGELDDGHRNDCTHQHVTTALLNDPVVR